MYPLLRAIETFRWAPEWEERVYRPGLLEHLHASLGVRQKGEYGVYGGTRVDLWIFYREVHWYVRIKKELNNQKRLNLQGELDDILAHRPSQDAKNFGIIDVVGVTSNRPGEQQTHIGNLEEIVRKRLGKNLPYRLIRVPISGPSDARLNDLVAKITDENRHDETSTGQAVGAEVTDG